MSEQENELQQQEEIDDEDAAAETAVDADADAIQADAAAGEAHAGDVEDSDDTSSQEQEEAPAKAKPAVTPEVLHSVAARENLRKQLANDVEEFLKQGGEIESVPINVRADPPKKPENNYGRGSI